MLDCTLSLSKGLMVALYLTCLDFHHHGQCMSAICVGPVFFRSAMGGSPGFWMALSQVRCFVQSHLQVKRKVILVCASFFENSPSREIPDWILGRIFILSDLLRRAVANTNPLRMLNVSHVVCGESDTNRVIPLDFFARFKGHLSIDAWRFSVLGSVCWSR